MDTTDLNDYESMEQFETDLKQYIHYYNYDRIKNRLKMSPVDYRNKTKI